MSDTPEQNQNAIENPGESSSTSEQHTWIITKPDPEADIVVRHSVRDVMQEDGQYTKHTTVVVLQAGCGCLVSYDPETRCKPPGSRCSTCNALACAKHSPKQATKQPTTATTAQI